MSKAGYIKIYYSACVKRLVQALNNNIKSYRQNHHNPLNPLKIIVPNGHIQKYLNRRLTEINGIVANMEFPFLESGLINALTETQSNDSQPPLLSIQDIEIMIFGFLCDIESRKSSVLMPLIDYLNDQQDSKLSAQKRWQLAQQLALLFIDYELTRPEMIQAWLNNQLFFKNTSKQHLKNIEAAQRDVYTTLFNKPDQGVTLNSLLRNFKIKEPVQSQPIFLFVPSRLSPLHLHMVLLLAQHYPVHIYHFNVCREFWLDLETDAEKTWRQAVRELDLTMTDANGEVIDNIHSQDANQRQDERFFDLEAGLETLENPLLKAWGKPGRETLRLLSDLENDAIHSGISYQDYLLDEEGFEEDQDNVDNTLSALQGSILNRIPAGDDLSPLKETVQMASAPSIDVEVAQVYNSILYELKQNPDLDLTDIAVLVTDMPAYRYVIEQVFERLNRHVTSPLRYSISDSSASEESLYAAAVNQLFNILETDFIRDEVFSFLSNPCVIAALDSHPAEVSNWLQTAVDLGIYRGYNTLYDSFEEDTRMLYTWQQGLQRLHRSLVQSNADSSMLSSHEIGRLSIVMYQLNYDKSLLNQKQNCQQWQHSLQTLLDTYINIPEDHSHEESVALAVSRDLMYLADSQPDLVLTFDEIKQYVMSRLADMSAGRGRYLSGGVVCASLQPMRPVPFKLTYVLGLGESQFPGQLRHNTLDLIAHSRRIGDTNRVENNKYLFLETLMSTREKLFLSYVGRDEQSGEELAPSVVINDVIDWLQQHSNPLFKPIILPLSSADNFKHPLKQGDASLLQNYSIRDYLLYCRQLLPDMKVTDVDVSAMTEQQMAAVNQFKSVYDLEYQSLINKNTNDEPISELSVRHLSDYLINPTERIFKQQGGVLNRIEDIDLLSDEPLTLNPLDKYNIVNHAVEADLKIAPDYLHSDCDIAMILDREYAHYLQQSRVPIQLFASIEPLKEIGNKKEYQSLKSMIESNKLMAWPGQLMIGQAFSQQNVAQQISPLVLSGRGGEKVLFTASVSHLLNDNKEHVAAQLIIRAGKHSKTKEYELLCQSFLEWCLMILHEDVMLAEEFQVWLIFQDKIKTMTFARHLVDHKIITDYLLRLSHEYIHGNNTYIPISLYKDLSFKYKKSDLDQPIKVYPFNSQFYFAYENLPDNLLESLKDNYYQAVESAAEIDKSFTKKYSPIYNEIKHILAYPPSDDIFADYKSRFMLFFALLENVDIRETS